MTLIKILGIIAGCALIILLIISSICGGDILEGYFKNRAGSNVKLKYSDFQKYYAVNPDRYILGEYVSTKGESYFIEFGFIDYIRYRFWRKTFSAKKQKAEDNERLAKYLRVVQRDIETKRKQSAEQYKEAADIINQIHI